jgi:hypothetical protein
VVDIARKRLEDMLMAVPGDYIWRKASDQATKTGEKELSWIPATASSTLETSPKLKLRLRQA